MDITLFVQNNKQTTRKNAYNKLRYIYIIIANMPGQTKQGLQKGAYSRKQPSTVGHPSLQTTVVAAGAEEVALVNWSS